MDRGGSSTAAGPDRDEREPAPADGKECRSGCPDQGQRTEGDQIVVTAVGRST